MYQIVLFMIQVLEPCIREYKRISTEQHDEQDSIIFHLEIYISHDMVMQEKYPNLVKI